MYTYINVTRRTSICYQFITLRNVQNVSGTFGLPFGMFLSQPVCMENGEWKPNFNFPRPEKKILTNIVSKVSEILIEYNLGKRFSMNRRESMPRMSEWSYAVYVKYEIFTEFEKLLTSFFFVLSLVTVGILNA